MKPRILVLARLDDIDGFKSYYVHEEYLNAIRKSKGIPSVYVPSFKWSKEAKSELLKHVKRCQGILLPGGTDVTKEDFFLIKYALANDIPILGICLGMQAMALYHNRSYLTLINKQNTHVSKELKAHAVNLTESHLSKILGTKRIIVNSRHFEQALSSKVFSIIGTSPDGVIEALENKNHRFQIGVQWHPETLYDTSEDSQRIFKTFIKNCLI